MSDNQPQSRKDIKRNHRCLILAISCLCGLFLATGCWPLAVDDDVIQERLDKATPPLAGSSGVGQTFLARRPNLSAVGILLAFRGEVREPPGASLIFHLRTSLDDPHDLVTAVASLQDKKHNDLVRFSFSAQPDSAGRRYYFLLESTSGSQAGIWYNSLDAYGEGAMYLGDQAQEGDLRFTTYYNYDLSLAARGALTALSHFAWPLLLAILLLFLPGYLLSHVLIPEEKQAIVSRLALALSLSLGIIPLLLLWTSTVGWRFSRLWATALIFLLTVAGAWSLRGLQVSRKELVRWAVDPYRLALAGICALTLATRYVQIRGLVLPLWVDSVHHTLISRLIAEGGKLPTSYMPFAPVEGFFRHFGFNALTAWLHWLCGIPIPQAILIMGQLVNAFVVLPVYLLVTRLTRQPLAGLIGAAVTGLISIMPAYYVSWGRYTQLAGMVILPTAMVIVMEALERPKRDRRYLALAAIVTAGLFLSHYRVLVFYVCFLVAYLLVVGARHFLVKVPTPSVSRQMSTLYQGTLPLETPRRYLARALLIGLGATVLVSPWLVVLLGNALSSLELLAMRVQADSGFNAFPWAFLEAGHGLLLTKLSLAAVLWSLLKSVSLALYETLATPSRSSKKAAETPGTQSSFSHSKRCSFSIAVALFRQVVRNSLSQLVRQDAPCLTILWVLLVGLVVNPHLLGLPNLSLVNNASAVISLFVPFSILIGYLFGDLLNAPLALLPQRGQAVYRYLLAVAILLAGLWGAKDMISIVNPATILATPEDWEAMAWIQQNIPPDAKFLINSRHWQREIYMGTDGGWWIPPLTDRKTTLPAIIYRGGTAEYMAAVNDLARWASEVPSLDNLEAFRRLQEAGVTHIYIGARGGHITPQMLEGSLYYQLIYSSGAVWIYRLAPPT